MKTMLDLETAYRAPQPPAKRPALDAAMDVLMSAYGWKPRKGTAKRR